MQWSIGIFFDFKLLKSRKDAQIIFVGDLKAIYNTKVLSN